MSNHRLLQGGLSVVGGGNAPSTLLNGLYAAWKMNETGNVNRADAVGGSTMVVNGTVNDAAGILGRAANFVGNVANYLECADNPDISPAGTSFTVAFWIKINTAGNQGFVNKFGGAGGSEYIVDCSATGYPRFLVYGFSTGASVTSAVAVNDSPAWNAIRAWYDKSANKVKIQVNAGAIAETATVGALNVSNGSMRWGMFENVSRPCNSAIDHGHFWKRVLTDAEWLEFYNGGAGKDFVP